jgi:hypothetical protein
MFDTDKVATAQFALDWERVVAKSRFCRLVTREDKVGSGDHMMWYWFVCKADAQRLPRPRNTIG